MKSALSPYVFVVLIFLGFSIQTSAQVKVPFDPRNSEFSPFRDKFELRGDFVILGNTNLTLENYGEELKNDNNMVFVDVDNDPNTFNSSMARLEIGAINNQPGGCASVVFAGLYWVGRGSPNTLFSVTKNGKTKQFDKREIKIKSGLSNQYTLIRAGEDDIRFPVGLDDQNDLGIFVGFADVTEYVRNSSNLDFYVADIGLLEGTNYHIGGWAMVVVFQDPQMPFREITVFDGYAYVRGDYPEEFNIPVSGFSTVEQGDVNVKLGILAGEGDIVASGDFFAIEKGIDTDNFIRLSHEGNTEDNFFYSSINTGGNARLPNLKNNTGLDLAVFNIPNEGNQIIGNSQNSLKFRYGTSWDALVIFNLTTAIDIRPPVIEAHHYLENINEASVDDVPEVFPDDELTFSVDIKNIGGVALSENSLSIPLPRPIQLIGTDIEYFFPSNNTGVPEVRTDLNGNPFLFWFFGDLPLGNDPDEVLARLTYTIKISNECAELLFSCNQSFHLDGKVSGKDSITGKFYPNTDFVRDYQDSEGGLCTHQPIYGALEYDIAAAEYLAKNCGVDDDVLKIDVCSSENPESISWELAAQRFPNGTRFFNEFPLTDKSVEYGDPTERNFPIDQHATFFAVFGDQQLCFKQFKFIENQIELDVDIQVSCEDVNGPSMVTIRPTNGIEPFLFYWNGELAPDTPTRVLGPGFHNLIVSSGNCSKELSIEVPARKNFDLVLDSTNSIVSNLCYNSSTGKLSMQVIGEGLFPTLTVTGSLANGDRYEQILENVTAGYFEFTTLEAGLYRAVLVDPNGCEKSIEKVITALPSITTSFSFSSLSFINSGFFIAKSDIEFDITTNLEDNWEVFWDFGDGGKSDERSPIHQYASSGEYVVSLTVKDEFGCEYATSKILRIEGQFLRFPTAFSPNGDGKNDSFFPVFADIEQIKFWIFDRWGEMLYYSSDKGSLGWDGTINGVKAPNGTYIFKVEYWHREGRWATETGSFLLVD
jgi:gliding motility-associated-like protein